MYKLLCDPSNKNNDLISTLYIRFMVSPSCKRRVIEELEKLKLSYFLSVGGIISFYEKPKPSQLESLRAELLTHGLRILDDESSKVIDNILEVINEMVHRSEQLPSLVYRDVITALGEFADGRIIRFFSEITGYTILQYIILHKIERAKELILYNDYSDKEIAKMLLYKNEAMMNAQFMKITGLYPDYYREIRRKRNLIAAAG